MLRFFMQCGVIGWPLLIIAIVNAVLIVRAAVRISRARAGSASRLATAVHPILFWGVMSAVLGFLGQHTGLYKAFTVISRAREISPNLVAAGLAESLTTTIFGLTIFVVSALAWFVLLSWSRRAGRMMSAAGLAVLMLAGGLACARGSESTPAHELTDGGWMGQGGPEQFVFEIRDAGDGTLTAMVHTLQEGRKTRELPITSVSYQAPDLDLFMAATGVHYRGRVDLAQGRIQGSVLAPNGGVTPMDLTWVESTTLPGYLAYAGAAQDKTVYTYSVPPALDDGWPVATPEDVGLSAAAMEALINAAIAGDGGVLHSVLVVRHGKLVAEEYFHGYKRDDLHGVLSCTKSVGSLLVGIARDQGHIKDLDTPLFDFFPGQASLRTADWDRVQLKHLLTMSMGLDWSNDEAENVHGTGEAFFGRVLSRQVAHAPGESWRYVNADADLLAGVLHHAAGVQADVFAREHLFAPLGITAYDWSAMAADGYPMMDGTLKLRPRDMAKLGALVLNGGRWDETQVVSEAWMQESTGARIQTDGPEKYGYLWWRAELPMGDGTIPVIFAMGLGSQFISVFPALDMIVVTTGGNQDNGKHFAPGRLLAAHVFSSMS